MKNRKLKPYQVGENDIVLAENEQEAIKILCDYCELSLEEFTLEDVNEQPLSLELQDEEGNVMFSIGEYIKRMDEPQYLVGWE